MKIGIIVLVTVVAIAFLLLTARAWGAPDPSAKAGRDADASSRAVARANADIEEHGWHLVAVEGEGSPGFVTTVGLWKSFRHPELVVFAPGRDPQGIAGRLAALATEVAEGRKLVAGERAAGAFGQHPAAVREVSSLWLPHVFGVAGGVYSGFDFPALQLYWPDAEGRFPWTSGFDPKLFALQPLLFEDNLVLANAGRSRVEAVVASHGPERLEASLDELFVELDERPGADPLASWRWLVGAEAEVYRATIFGDLFIRTPDGKIHWLDTGAGFVQPVAADREGWLHWVIDRPAAFIHPSTLFDLRSRDYAPKQGEVYDWITSPLLGGEDHADNVQTVLAEVHLDASGQLAEQLERGGAAAEADAAADDTIYAVVINEEKQYSMWPAGEPIPAGWQGVGKTGTKAECLDYIEEVWTDMRPESLRKARAAEDARDQD